MQSYLKGNVAEDVLRKQYFRVPASIPGASIAQEENSAISFQNQLFAEDLISSKIPQASDFTSDYVIRDASAAEYYPDISFGRGDMAEYYRNEIQNLEKWVDLVLKPLPQSSDEFNGTIATTYSRFAKTTKDGRQDPTSICLLSNTIPANFANTNPDYRYRVKVNGVVVPPADKIYKWYFDTGTGLLTFYGRVPRSTDEVKISFTRYIGAKGIENLSLSQFENVVDEFAIRHFVNDSDIESAIEFPTTIADKSYIINGTNANGSLRISNKYDYGEYTIDISPFDSTDEASRPAYLFSDVDTSYVELNGFIQDDSTTDISDLIVEDDKKVGVVDAFKGALVKVLFPSFIRLIPTGEGSAITADMYGNTLRDFNVYGLNNNDVWILLKDASGVSKETTTLDVKISEADSKTDIKGIAIVVQRLNEIEGAGATLKLYNLRFNGKPRTRVSNVFGLENTVIGINDVQKIGFGRFDPEYNLDVSGDIRASGKFIVDDRIDVSGDILTRGNMTVEGGLDVSGPLDISGDILTRGNMTVEGGLDVSGPLDISGDIVTKGQITTEGGFINLSDMRVKSNIETIDSASSKLMQLRGVYYDMRGTRRLGLVAQELKDIIPEAVFEMNNGYYGVEYGNLVGLLIEGFKEQEERLREVERKMRKVREKGQ